MMRADEDGKGDVRMRMYRIIPLELDFCGLLVDGQAAGSDRSAGGNDHCVYGVLLTLIMLMLPLTTFALLLALGHLHRPGNFVALQYCSTSGLSILRIPMVKQLHGSTPTSCRLSSLAIL